MPIHYESLSYKNKFTFTCPVFNAKTTMGACTRLRDMTTAGKTMEIRKGCQAAMKCGMCPAAAMVQMYWQNSSWKNDHHGSLESKEGKLHAQVLERIVRVVPQEPVLSRIGVSASERDLMHTARERIEAQLNTAPGETFNRREVSDYEAPKRKRKTAAPTPKPEINNKLAEAARTGDLSAAINA